ncbi:MAG: ArsR family transcriptional regulator [Paracoccaceae bacterium]|jgi:DNA-binding transcriptional ArsR family regulator|tara:strand:- start:271 stop:627 length:357 start_codon:yes stop_codon:yes gene_type:complete
MKQYSSPVPVEQAASTFAALGSEQRLGVLRTLVRAGPEGLAIGTLGDRSGISGSTLTHHLKILMQAGLISQIKKGRSIICIAVAYAELSALADFLLSECCADTPDTVLPAQDKDHSHE